MILTCPKCSKEHIINASAIPEHVKMVRCKFCEHSFLLPRQQAKKETSTPCVNNTMRKIGVTLSKGGVGKTTTAVNLAHGLSLAGYKVLLIDTDTQGQSAYMLGVKPEAGLVELVTEKTSPENAICQAREKLWLLAGAKSLAGVKRLIDRKDFGGEKTLSLAFESYEDKFDYVIVDTSPGWDPLTVNVLFYVNEILAPVSLEVMTLQGLVEFTKSIAAIKKYRANIGLNYILPTFLDNRVKKSAAILDKLKEIYGDKVCAPVRYNVKISESPAYGKTILELDPQSNGAKDYQALVDKISGKAVTGKNTTFNENQVTA